MSLAGISANHTSNERTLGRRWLWVTMVHTFRGVETESIDAEGYEIFSICCQSTTDISCVCCKTE
jgi:hypothetical protein